MTTTANKPMKRIGKITALVLAGVIISMPAVSTAQDGVQNHRIVHQRIKNHFDKNGDGVLTGREAIHARNFHTRWHNQHQRPDVRPHRRHPVVGRSE